MSPQKQVDETMMSSLNETIERDERVEEDEGNSHSGWKSFLWHGGSVYDAWFSCASNQVAQVLLTLPYSFSQLGMLSGIIFQVFYGLLGSWTAYLISILYIEYRSRKEKENVSFKNHVIQWFEVLEGLLGPYWKAIGLAFNCTFLLFGSVIQLIACASNIYYINDHLDKRTWTYIFGACCATTVFIPSFHNYRIWSFLGLGMTTYTAWYLTIAALVHGKVENVTHTGPNKLVLYFTGATNILYTFGGHAVTVLVLFFFFLFFCLLSLDKTIMIVFFIVLGQWNIKGSRRSLLHNHFSSIAAFASILMGLPFGNKTNSKIWHLRTTITITLVSFLAYSYTLSLAIKNFKPQFNFILLIFLLMWIALCSVLDFAFPPSHRQSGRFASIL